MAIIQKNFGADEYKAQYSVESTEDGMRLDQFIQRYLKTFSREAIKQKIERGEIVIEGRPAVPHKPSVRLHTGDMVTLTTPQTTHEDEIWENENINAPCDPEIVFEDGDLLVISKPPFMSTHPTGKHLFNCATVYFENIHKHPIHSIHRLDRETSGILLLAKNIPTAKEVTPVFEHGEARKCYFFIAHTTEKFKGQHEFVARERLGGEDKGLRRVEIQAFPEASEEGKRAETRFEILHRSGTYALGLAFPRTGRQHQIRVHAACHGLPLLGDKIYHQGYELFQRFKDGVATDDDHKVMQIPRHALHAMGLKIPYKGEHRVFIAHLPNDLKKWIAQHLKLDLVAFENQLMTQIEAELRQ